MKILGQKRPNGPQKARQMVKNVAIEHIFKKDAKRNLNELSIV